MPMLLMIWLLGAGWGEERANALCADPSGHYVRYQHETLLLAGVSGTQCVLQNAHLDYRRWIDDCQRWGIRAVHLWSFMAPRQQRDGSVVEARYGYVYPGVAPWPRRTGGPPAHDGLPQWDLTRFDEKGYWPRLRDLCRRARDRGMVVGITVFFGWPKWNTRERPDWSYHPFNLLNGGFLTDERPITEACQTIHSPGVEVVEEPWSPAWPPAKKTQWVWERLSRKLIEELNPLGNVFFVFMDEHSYPEGNGGDHFLRFFRRRGALWVDGDQRRIGVDFVCSPTFGGQDKNADAVEHFVKEPARPYLFLEGEPYTGEEVRTAMWTFLIGGGHYFYHDDAGQETVTTGVMQYDPNVQGCDMRAHDQRMRWLGHASRFFNRGCRDLGGMAPHNELVVAGHAYCLANPGQQYAVYARSGDSFALNLSQAGAAALVGRFFNPRTGAYLKPFTVAASRQARFGKPDEQDWALIVSSTGARTE